MAGALMKTLEEVPASERQQVLIDALCDQMARVMGFDNAEQIDPTRPLQELGLDSLMAVEMRNVVNGFVGRALPATLLFKYPSLSELTGFLTTELFPNHDAEIAEELGEEFFEDADDSDQDEGVDLMLLDRFTSVDSLEEDTNIIQSKLKELSDCIL